MSMFVEGAIRYPNELPCPEVDTDLVPRERRYISDIGQVKKLRRFQRDYQATRQNISFVFTPNQARDFQEWYRNDIVEGGAWFYADWPILHKEKDIAYRFVTRPVWKALALGNWHVSATVELYEGRKVGRYLNVFTSKIYPYYFSDALRFIGTKAVLQPFAAWAESVGLQGAKIVAGSYVGYKYSTYDMESEDITFEGTSVVGGSYIKYIYENLSMQEESVQFEGTKIVFGDMPEKLVAYDYFNDNGTQMRGIIITSGELE